MIPPFAGTEEGPYEGDPDTRRSRPDIGELAGRVREMFAHRESSEAAEREAQAVIDQGLRDLAAEERRQFEDAIRETVGAFAELVSNGQVRVFVMGALTASFIWIMALCVAVLLTLIHH